MRLRALAIPVATLACVVVGLTSGPEADSDAPAKDDRSGSTSPHVSR